LMLSVSRKAMSVETLPGSSSCVTTSTESIGVSVLPSRFVHCDDSPLKPLSVRSSRGESSLPTSACSSGDTPPSQLSHVVFAICLYCFLSLAIVYFNRWLFTKGYPYPVFVSWIQQVVGLLVFVWLGSFGRFSKTMAKLFPLQWLDPKVMWKVIPLTICFVGMVGLANVCLKHVLVATYQVARSLTIIFTVFLSYLILSQSQSMSVLGACGMMVTGFIISSLDTSESGLSLPGILAGGTSSFFQALYQVFIKKSIVYTDNNSNLLLFYNLFLSSFIFIPVVFLLNESEAFLRLPGPGHPDFWVVWPSLFVSGVLGTLLNLATYMCVNATSPLTFNIVGFTKSCVQSLGGVIFLGDTIGFQSGAGILLTLLASGWYTKLKVDEQKLSSGGVRVSKEDRNDSYDDEDTECGSLPDALENGESTRLVGGQLVNKH